MFTLLFIVFIVILCFVLQGNITPLQCVGLIAIAMLMYRNQKRVQAHEKIENPTAPMSCRTEHTHASSDGIKYNNLNYNDLVPNSPSFVDAGNAKPIDPYADSPMNAEITFQNYQPDSLHTRANGNMQYYASDGDIKADYEDSYSTPFKTKQSQNSQNSQNSQFSQKQPSIRYKEQNPYPWGSNPKYTGCYPQVPFDLNGCNTGAYLSYDEANARLAALRQRDKKALDGVVTKNSNYYKRHFSTELDEAEAKRWWGSSEY